MGRETHPSGRRNIFRLRISPTCRCSRRLDGSTNIFWRKKDVAELIRKGRDYTLEDQRFVITLERELIGRVLPVHAEAAKKGLIEISTSPFYHPILPLVCDTANGRGFLAGAAFAAEPVSAS